VSAYRLIRRDAFKRDLIDQYLAIYHEQPDAADRFAQRVDALIERIAEYPLSGHTWDPGGDPDESRLDRLRVLTVSGFKVMVFYQLRDDRILFLRALHGSRGDMLEVLSEELGSE